VIVKSGLISLINQIIRNRQLRLLREVFNQNDQLEFKFLTPSKFLLLKRNLCHQLGGVQKIKLLVQDKVLNMWLKLII